MICQVRSVVDQEMEDRDFALCMLLHKAVVSLLHLYINKDVDYCAMLDQQLGHFEVVMNATVYVMSFNDQHLFGRLASNPVFWQQLLHHIEISLSTKCEVAPVPARSLGTISRLVIRLVIPCEAESFRVPLHKVS